MILYNPHVDDFVGNPIQFLLVGRRSLRKYGFLLSEPIRRNIKVKIYKDSSMSCILPLIIFTKLPAVVRYVITEFEFKIWLYLNNLSKKHYVRFSKDELDNKTLLTFSYKSATGLFSERNKIFKRCKHVIFHLSHYFVNTKLKSDNIKACKNAILAGDSDITENSFYKKYFSWYQKDFCILHFAVQERFKKLLKLSSRNNAAVATGSYHRLSEFKPASLYQDFINHFHTNSYHSLREEISLAHIDPKFLRSHISLYNAPSKVAGIKKFFKVSRQKKYFSLDIVQEYNQFKCAFVGEELSGFPAIGAFEAMACGCILIAETQYYSGLKLKPDYNFLPFNGTLEDFFRVLKEALMSNQLSKMSKNSVDFINTKFREDIVYDFWVKQLREIKK